VEERHSHQGQSGFTATPAASPSAAPRHHRFRTDAQIARRLQKARSAPDSARKDRRGCKLIARRPLVRGGGPRGRLGAIVCGSVTVTRDGRRCGKGEGYSDLEFAILRELGHPPMPVATTVHDLQVVTSVPRDPTDQPLSVIATPTHAIPHQAPQRRTDGYRLEAPQRRGPSGNADSGRTQENDNIERLKRPVTLMEDLDFVTRLERSGQTADAAEPVRKPIVRCRPITRSSGPRPSWADRSSRRVSRGVAGRPPIGVVRWPFKAPPLTAK